MRNKREFQINIKPKFAIVVDGETEFWYLQMLKRNEKLIKVDIKPEIPQKKKLADQYSKVIELIKSYDKVYWIIDLDVVLKESAQVKKGKRKPIDAFIEYKRKIEKKSDKIILIINQPCLEFWFLTHYIRTAQPYNNCEEAGRQLKKHIPDYEKTEKYFTKQDNDIYIKLRPYLATAINHSKYFASFDIDSPNNGLTEMYKLFSDIGVPKE